MFIVILNYIQPLSAIEAHLDEHRRFLDRHHATGHFLASGPQLPRTGGVILARVASRRELCDVLMKDFTVTSGGVEIKSRDTFKKWVAAFLAIIDEFDVIETFQNETGDQMVSRWRVMEKNNGFMGSESSGLPIDMTGTAVLQVGEDGLLWRTTGWNAVRWKFYAVWRREIAPPGFSSLHQASLAYKRSRVVAHTHECVIRADSDKGRNLVMPRQRIPRRRKRGIAPIDCVEWPPFDLAAA